jgi:hypothetical protein
MSIKRSKSKLFLLALIISMLFVSIGGIQPAQAKIIAPVPFGAPAMYTFCDNVVDVSWGECVALDAL